MQYEYQMKDLEVLKIPYSPFPPFNRSNAHLSRQSKLSESLSNFRAIDGLLKEAADGLNVCTIFRLSSPLR